ncbi:MAG: hypothetical protein NC319_07710 [Butyricicoccus sp.]|nr:hypothetical protein [Butyricicoccus sp.]
MTELPTTTCPYHAGENAENHQHIVQKATNSKAKFYRNNEQNKKYTKKINFSIEKCTDMM